MFLSNRVYCEKTEVPPQFGKIVRKRWEEHNIDKGIEAVMGYLTSLAAWAGDELAQDGVDLVLHWLAVKGQEYLDRVDRDFMPKSYGSRSNLGCKRSNKP